MGAASLEGRTLGKYRVLEPLGRGGMARVYRAYHPQLDRYVAVKVLRSDLVDEGVLDASSWRARFQREARAVAALRHPNVVQVFDFDVQDDLYYMVMELLEGDTLKMRLNDYRVRGEKMPLGEVVRILLDVLDGLAYAHSEGMIHRDIKPGNILLTRLGQAVLGDFGIAQIVGGTRHTTSGALMGTLNYMAPEQGMEGRSDARSDIYSLGVVCYEMLVQRPPFEADTPLALLMKHVNDPLPLPRQIDSTIPEPFERIVLKALAKGPEDRYQSAEEMAQALHEATEQVEVKLPARISLPLSFTTDEAPSESVAVLSGTAREKIGGAAFTEDETDTTLGQKRAAAKQTGDEPTQELKNALRSLGRAVAEKAELESLGRMIAEKTTHALQQAVEAVEGGAEEAPSSPKPPAPSSPPTEERSASIHKIRPILSAVGVLFVVNILAVVIAGVTRLWSIFAIGWPMELFLVASLLSAVMVATGEPRMLIPVGIVSGNGLIFLYCTVTHNWRYWVFLWVFEVWLLIGVLWLTLRLTRQKDRLREKSRALGQALGLVFALMGAATLGLSIVIAAVSTVIDWIV